MKRRDFLKAVLGVTVAPCAIGTVLSGDAFSGLQVIDQKDFTSVWFIRWGEEGFISINPPKITRIANIDTSKVKGLPTREAWSGPGLSERYTFGT